jgi:hypothetical protein
MPIVWAAVAIALTLPSISVGLVADDWVHRATVSQPPSLRGVLADPADIFSFVDASRIGEMVDRGILPWWTDSTTRVAFWRPLSAWTHRLDYSVWRESPAIMHAHSLAWLAALVLAVGGMSRRLSVTPWAGGLAGLLYAIDDVHGFATGWLANRNVLVATFFAALCLLAHDRWRRHAWRPGAALAPGALMAALLASEAAVATAAYLLAHALCLDTGDARRRMRGLLPSVAVFSAWLVTHRSLGYGTSSAWPLYVSPILEPVEFVRTVLERGPILLAAQWLGVSANTFSTSVGLGASVRWLASSAILGLLCLVLWPLLRSDSVARFWGTGQLLALVPAASALPEDRQLFFVGLGAMGVLGRYLTSVLAREPFWTRSSRVWAASVVTAVVLAVIHLVLAPVRLAIASAEPGAYGRYLEAPALTLPEDPVLAGQTLVIPHIPALSLSFYLPFIRAGTDRPVPGRVRVLAVGSGAVTLSRLDARTVVVRTEGVPNVLDWLFRPRDAALQASPPTRLTGTTIEATRSASDGSPTEVVCRFDRDLEARNLLWLRWEWHAGQGRFAPVSPPRVGETVRLQ